MGTGKCRGNYTELFQQTAAKASPCMDEGGGYEVNIWMSCVHEVHHVLIKLTERPVAPV